MFLRIASLVLLVIVSGFTWAESVASPVVKLLDVTLPAITEMSGIVKSERYDDVYWVHNDSGDNARLFAVNGNGKAILPAWLAGDYHGEQAEPDKEPWPGVTILNADNVDWEAIAIDGDTLYVAEMGNNGNARRDLGIYVITEPNPHEIERTRASSFIPVRYPDQDQFPPPNWHYDSEALFAVGGKLYVLTKHRQPGKADQWESGTVLYRLDDMAIDRVNTLKRIDANPDVFIVTAADVSPDGQHLVVLCYTELWVFDKPRRGDKWLSGAARRLPLNLAHTKQAEAVVFRDNETILIANEQREWFTVKLGDVPPYTGTK